MATIKVCDKCKKTSLERDIDNRVTVNFLQTPTFPSGERKFDLCSECRKKVINIILS